MSVIEILLGQSTPRTDRRCVRLFVMDTDFTAESTVIEKQNLTKAFISQSAFTDEETKSVARQLKCSRVLDVVAAPEFPI